MVPLFFHDDVLTADTEVTLYEDTAKHVVQVLRMQSGGKIALTNGKGYRAEASIRTIQKRNTTVWIDKLDFYEKRTTLLHLGVAFTKNSSRNEWILEKVTELGACTIIPLQTNRSEREKFRFDRWRNILVAAIIQSQQYYLPDLRELTTLEDLANEMGNTPQKLVAHCIDNTDRMQLSEALQKEKETLLLIGPEGDFTGEEVKELTSKGFAGIAMGANRLRTETAAVTACAFFNMVNYE